MWYKLQNLIDQLKFTSSTHTKAMQSLPKEKNYVRRHCDCCNNKQLNEGVNSSTALLWAIATTWLCQVVVMQQKIHINLNFFAFEPHFVTYKHQTYNIRDLGGLTKNKKEPRCVHEIIWRNVSMFKKVEQPAISCADLLHIMYIFQFCR